MKQANLSGTEEVTAAFQRFRIFLLNSWPVVNEVMMTHDWDNDPYFLDDWLNVNWKHLFTRQLLAKHADFQPFVTSINEIHEHHYQYYLQLNLSSKKRFFALGCNENGFVIGPPFDQVQVIGVNGTLELFPLKSLQFKIIAQDL